MRVDIGRLTAEETESLFREIIEVGLTEEQLLRLLNECLSKNQKDELAVQWEE